MIAQISIGVKDIDRSKRFYDAALEPLGYKCIRPAKALVGYGYGAHTVSLWVVSAERPIRQTKSQVFTSALRHRTPPPWMHPMRWRCARAGIMVCQACAKYSSDYYAAFIIDPTDIG